MFAFVLILVGLTSGGAFVLGTTWLGWPGRRLGAALGRMLECLGMTLMFFVANLALGLLLMLAVRVLTPAFVSLYVLNNLILLVMSGLQGITFCCWRTVVYDDRPRQD